MAEGVGHRIRINETDISNAVEFTINENPYKLVGTCKIVMAAKRLGYPITQTGMGEMRNIKRGDNLEIVVGYNGNLFSVFKGCVSEVGIGDRLVIYGEDNMFIARITRAEDVTYVPLDLTGDKKKKQADRINKEIQTIKDNVEIVVEGVNDFSSLDKKTYADNRKIMIDGEEASRKDILGEGLTAKIKVASAEGDEAKETIIARYRAIAANKERTLENQKGELERSLVSVTFRDLIRDLVRQMNEVPRTLRTRLEQQGLSEAQIDSPEPRRVRYYPYLTIDFNGTDDFVISSLEIKNESILSVFRKVQRLCGYLIYFKGDVLHVSDVNRRDSGRRFGGANYDNLNHRVTMSKHVKQDRLIYYGKFNRPVRVEAYQFLPDGGLIHANAGDAGGEVYTVRNSSVIPLPKPASQQLTPEQESLATDLQDKPLDDTHPNAKDTSTDKDIGKEGRMDAELDKRIKALIAGRGEVVVDNDMYEDALRKFAERKLAFYKYDGYLGTVNLYYDGVIYPLEGLWIVDTRYPERTGLYLVNSVITTMSKSVGISKAISLGVRLDRRQRDT